MTAYVESSEVRGSVVREKSPSGFTAAGDPDAVERRVE